MKQNWVLKEILYSYEECMRIVELASKKESKRYVDSPAIFKKVNTIVVENKDMDGLLDKFYDMTESINDEYFGFDIKKPKSFNLNSYEKHNNEYPYHLDKNCCGSMNDIKLTSILNISLDPYQGGEFEFFTGKDERVTNVDITGSLLVFPSFLYHRVKPVTSGKRITISAWFTGPNWK
jgi:PKHD-type hydroxylase